MSEGEANTGNDNSSTESQVGFTPSSDGFFSTEKIIERLAKSRDEAGRLSNRFFVSALILQGLALLKLAELDLPLTFLGLDTGDLKYGLFFFVVAAQLCTVLSTSRTMDSRAYDYQIEKIAKVSFPNHFREAARTVPNPHEWLSPSSEILESIEGRPFSKLVYNLAMAVTALFVIAVVFGPNVLGVYYLWNHDALITEGDRDLQYWMVLSVTVLSILWSFAYWAIHAMTEDEGGKSKHGN